MIRGNQITVIIPTYNSQDYISKAINSVKSQLEEDINIIISDDGSTDNTVSIAKECGVKVIVGEHKGASSARNMALEFLDTPYFFFLDSDDILCEDAFKTFIEIMDNDDTVMAVFAMAVDFISEELSEEQKSKLLVTPRPYSGLLTGCTFMRKEVYDQIGGFKEDLCPGEVVDWMIRLRSSGLKIVQIQNITIKRRLHLNNYGRREKKNEARNIAAILRARMMEARDGKQKSVSD